MRLRAAAHHSPNWASAAAYPPVNVCGRGLRTPLGLNEMSILVTGVGAGTHDTTCDGSASEGAQQQLLSGHLRNVSETGAAGYGEARW